MEMILKTTNLCKSFSGQTAVNNISLNIEKISVYGLLGPNGAGKSTTLKMITGILKPTSGNIVFDGHAWKRSDLSHIGALIEMPPLYENLTAYENLKVRTTILGLTDKRIDEVLQIVRLTETGKKRAGQFSLGMKQRLGIAVALLNNPKLLIFLFLLFVIGIHLLGMADTVQLGMLIGAAAGMAFCNLIIYILHLFLSFKFGLGLSLFWGVFESLQCILYSNIELKGVARYIPFAWSMNWVQDILSRQIFNYGTEKICVVCFSLAGCSLQEKIKEYSSDKEQCYLDAENVTQFSFKGNDYTILEDTVSNGGLGEWIGYIRQLAAVDETGKVLLQENIEAATFQTLTDLADKAPEAAYIIPFLNVYAAPNADDYLIVDVNGGYHKAVRKENIKDTDTVFDFKNTELSMSGKFEINPENATQLLCDGIIYQVTSDTVSNDELGSWIDIFEIIFRETMECGTITKGADSGTCSRFENAFNCHSRKYRLDKRNRA